MNVFFRNVIYKGMFLLGVFCAVGTVVKMLIEFDIVDVLILLFSLGLPVWAYYKQKKENEEEKKLIMKRAAEEYRREKEKKELLERKAADAEIEKAAGRYDEVDYEKNFRELEFDEEDEFKEMFGFLSIRVKNVLRFFISGNLYDKVMCLFIILAVFMLYEPYSLYNMSSLAFMFLDVAYIIVAIAWCGGEFWLPMAVPAIIVKFIMSGYIAAAMVLVSLIAFSMAMIKKRMLSNSPVHDDNLEGYVAVAPEISKLSPEELLLSRYHNEAYDDITMSYTAATAAENERLGLDTILTEEDFKEL